MTSDIATRHRRRPLRAGVAFGLLATVLVVAPAAAARPAITRVVDIGFHTEQHFDADPSCGPYSIAVTEIAEGNDHLVIVDDGTRLSVAFGETFRITAVPDDPALPTDIRQGTDALHFTLKRDGDVLFHESFHDYGAAAWDPDAQIRYMTTFTTRDGEVLVDHSIVNDMPPPGC
jgi:hypothetical protein